MGTNYTLATHLAELIAAGYAVTFSPGTDLVPYFADLDKDDDPDAGMTAGGNTPSEALWAASPLHGDDEPYPGEAMLPVSAFAEILGLTYDEAYRNGRQAVAAPELAKARAVLTRAEDELSKLLTPAPCRCSHKAGSHWEIAEPGSVSEVHGPRTGCAILGCGCEAYSAE